MRSAYTECLHVIRWLDRFVPVCTLLTIVAVMVLTVAAFADNRPCPSDTPLSVAVSRLVSGMPATPTAMVVHTGDAAKPYVDMFNRHDPPTDYPFDLVVVIDIPGIQVMVVGYEEGERACAWAQTRTISRPDPA